MISKLVMWSSRRTFTARRCAEDDPEMVEQTEIYEKDLPLMRARALAGLDVLKASR